MKYLSYIAWFVILSIFLTLESCSSTEGKDREKLKATEQAVKVKVTKVKQSRPVYTLSLPGELLPYEQVDIFPKVRGFVNHIYVDMGSHVHKGQLLIELDAPEISQQYLSAKSDEQSRWQQYQYSKQVYVRLKKAAASNGAIAAIELDKALAQMRSDSAAYAAAGARVAEAGQMQRYLRITAPFDGVIMARDVSPGALVGDNSMKNTALLSIAQQERLRLRVALPEKHAQSVFDNTKASFYVSDQPGAVFTAALSRNSGLIGEDARSRMLEFDVDNKGAELSGGEFAQVKVSLQRPASSLWVPVSCVVHAQSGTFILKVVGSSVKRIDVTEGLTQGKLQEIFADISAGDTVIVQGNEELISAKRIRPLL